MDSTILLVVLYISGFVGSVYFYSNLNWWDTYADELQSIDRYLIVCMAGLWFITLPVVGLTQLPNLMRKS